MSIDKFKIAIVTALASQCFMTGNATGQIRDFGRLDLNATSGGSDSPILIGVNGTIDKSFPIEVAFISTASGTEGPNRGVSDVFFQVDTGLPLIDQMSMTLSKQFTVPANTAATTTAPGAGFTIVNQNGLPIDTDADPNLDTIDGVGGSQGSSHQFTMGTMGKQGPELEFAGRFAPLQVATGDVKVDRNTPLGTYIINFRPQFAAMWTHRPGNANGNEHPPSKVEIPRGGDTLTVIVVPEPTTLFLLTPVALAALRRKNQLPPHTK